MVEIFISRLIRGPRAMVRRKKRNFLTLTNQVLHIREDRIYAAQYCSILQYLLNSLQWGNYTVKYNSSE